MKWYTGLMVLMTAGMLAGCGDSGVDENTPVEQVAAEAAQMGQAELQKMVDKYEGLIADKAAELDGLKAQLKELSVSELMGEKAKTLKTDLGNITSSIDNLKDQLAVYVKELKASAE